MPNKLGSLSAIYESAKQGSAAISTDSTGGWSYGTYQIATKPGTMKKFLEFANKTSPTMAERLNAAGGNEAALRGADGFKKAWLELAKDPAFNALQHDFIASTHYLPLAKKVKDDTGLDAEKHSIALQNVIWSVAVQHGPGSSVITRALSGKGVTAMDDGQIIDAIYDERSADVVKDGKKVLKYFPSSTEKVQESVRNRYRDERIRAKEMLANE